MVSKLLGAEPWQDPDAQPFVRVEGVTKTFGSVYAVDAVTLHIYQGELFSLLGSSGCGKTTLLRMLAGFEKPSSGRIYIDGMDVTDMPPYERPVNMMFQSYALFPHLSVASNIAFGLRQQRMPKGEINDRVQELLELVRLGNYGKRKPDQLSGGQRQRVALARALAKKPKLLLLDEPLGALDKKLREHTQFELVGIQERLGTTFVMVTHDQEEALTMSSRLAVMHEGRVSQIGTPQHVYEQPNCRFVADFLGAANLLPGRVVGTRDEGIEVAIEGLDEPLIAGDGTAGVEPGMEVTVAIRPEKMLLGDKGENKLRGVVQDIAYLGDISIYHLRLPSGRVIQAQVTNRVRGGGAHPVWDDEVTVSWNVASATVLSS